MIPRHAAQTLARLAKSFPVLTVTGPRQSGKTTLVRASFPGLPYVSLEDPEQRLFAAQDPRRFLARYRDGAIFDEAQNVPDLFSYLQTKVDLDRPRGRFVLTGSQNLALSARVSQSLAGRTAVMELLPLSLAELREVRLTPATLDDVLFKGLYPRLHADAVSAGDWYSAYVMTYLERDMRQLSAIQDLNTFQRFFKLCAARTGQLLNLSSMAQDCGIAHGTAQSWLGVLEASYLAFRLTPHFENFGKRLVKSPKLYFYDTGLAANLLGIRNPEQLSIRPERPALFETLIVNEFMKRALNAGRRPGLFFWRDNLGTEVDLLIEEGTQLFAAEIKSGSTFQPEFLRSLTKWMAYAGRRAGRPALIYGGDDSYEREAANVISWRSL
jgi:predicted AAA+ superfamily ATPase